MANGESALPTVLAQVQTVLNARAVVFARCHVGCVHATQASKALLATSLFPELSWEEKIMDESA